MFRNAKRFTAILLVLILAASTYAFAAANTVPDNNYGYGKAALAVTGYTIGAPTYTNDPLDMSKLKTVSFTVVTIAPNTIAATKVLLNVLATNLVADYGNNTCTNALTVWTCTFGTALDPALAVSFHVIANSNP